MIHLDYTIFESHEYIPIGITDEYHLLKIYPNVAIEHVEDASAVSTGPYAGVGYNPFAESHNNSPDTIPVSKSESPVSFEANAQTRNASGSEPTKTGLAGLKQGVQNTAEKVSGDTNSLKRNVSNFMKDPKTQAAVKTMKQTAGKVQDFAKSSVAKVNGMPEATQAKMINEKIISAKEEPRTLADNLKQGMKAAGKGLAIAGLAMVSLPVAAAAIVADRTINSKTKAAAAEELQGQMIHLDAQIQKADQDGDYDKKADLLVAKRTAMQAHAKLKYGLKRKIDKVLE